MKAFVKASVIEISEHGLLLMLLSVFFLLLKDAVGMISVILTVSYWYIRTKTKTKTWILVAVYMFVLGLPRYTDALDMRWGRVVEVHEKYAVLQKGRARLLVYSDDPLLYDSYYEITGTKETLNTSLGFFKFDFASYCQRKGITYCVDSSQCTLIKETFSLRAKLQKKINDFSDKEKIDIFNKVLLNISTSDDDNSAWVYQSGFSYAAMLGFLEYILKFFFEEKRRRKILTFLNFFLVFFYGFPVLLVQSLVFRLFSFTSLKKSAQTGIGTCLVLIMYPQAIYSASFLIPFVYRTSFMFAQSRRITSLTLILIIQSVLFHKINLLTACFYPVIRFFIGLLWLTCVIDLFIPIFSFSLPLSHFGNCLSILNRFALNGSILGPGLVFFALIILFLCKHKYFSHIFLIILIIFQFNGLFHPFAEITFINVGQGDSILIRAPFNTCNILVDTGKPSQWNTLNSFLEAKGINRLDALIITHSDDDHAGNAQKITDNYQPSQIITDHFGEAIIDPFVLYDLNTIVNDDENESSLTTFFGLNGMNIMLAGDIDEKAETEIARKYALLEADILKLAHHGSNTASSALFLDTLKPELAVISCGAYSLYHHPSSDTLQRLMERHIPYVITREVGDISVFCIGPFNVMITSDLHISFI